MIKNKRYDKLVLWAEIIPFCLWSIWKTRNDNVFYHTMKDDFFDHVYAHTVEYAHLSTKGKIKTPITSTIIKWEPLKRDTFKLNINDSCLGNPKKGRIRGVIRNHDRDWMVGYNKIILNDSNNQMELLALLEGLKIIKQFNLMPIEINTDSMKIIKMRTDNNLLYAEIIDDCRYRLRKLGKVICHSFREQNMVADALTKMRANSNVF